MALLSMVHWIFRTHESCSLSLDRPVCVPQPKAQISNYFFSFLFFLFQWPVRETPRYSCWVKPPSNRSVIKHLYIYVFPKFLLLPDNPSILFSREVKTAGSGPVFEGSCKYLLPFLLSLLCDRNPQGIPIVPMISYTPSTFSTADLALWRFPIHCFWKLIWSFCFITSNIL